MSGKSSLPGRVKRAKDPIYVRLRGGVLVPANPIEAERLAGRKYGPDDVLRCELHKGRNPRHHRLVMQLLRVLVDNSATLATVDQALTLIKIKLGRAQPFIDASTLKTYWVVESISFDAMDQSDFDGFWRDLCALIARDFWPEMSPEQVEAMAGFMPD